MQLKVGSNISNNKVLLMYMATPDKPAKTPSYIISKENADEFVNMYNTQSKKLKNFSVISTLIGAFSGTIAGLTKKNLSKTLIYSLIGAISGMIVSTIYSYTKKNNLMDKYSVKKYSR
jgi:uncharacterized membrane protein